MPTYEYRCTGCSNDFELFQKMSDEPVAACPRCGAAGQRRMSGGAGLVFKGSGFYITDYARGDSYKKAAQADGGAAPPAAPAKSDSAPAASPPPSTSGGSSAKSE